MPKAKLGMTITPSKPTPFDKLGQRMEEGAEEQGKLEKQGVQILDRMGAVKGASKTQQRLPKVPPTPGKGRSQA